MKKTFDFKTMWGKIDSKDLAQKTIKEAGYGYIFVAVLQGVAGVFLKFYVMFLDAGLFALFGFLLLKFKNRVTAFAALIFSLLNLTSTVFVRLGYYEGGRNVILALIIFWISVRAVQATGYMGKHRE
jgi:hypothetical protein